MSLIEILSNVTDYDFEDKIEELEHLLMNKYIITKEDIEFISQLNEILPCFQIMLFELVNEYHLFSDDEKNIYNNIQLNAVKKRSSNIGYISNPSLEVQLAVVKRDKEIIHYINNPHPEVLEYLKK